MKISSKNPAKQIEEADFVLINRIDQMSDEQLSELRQLVSNTYPQTTVLGVSALTGQGFDQLIRLLERRDAFAHRNIDVVQLDRAGCVSPGNGSFRPPDVD